jgi:hypothetical protein
MMPALRWHVVVSGAGLDTKQLGGAHASKLAVCGGKRGGGELARTAKSGGTRANYGTNTCIPSTQEECIGHCGCLSAKRVRHATHDLKTPYMAHTPKMLCEYATT